MEQVPPRAHAPHRSQVCGGVCLTMSQRLPHQCHSGERERVGEKDREGEREVERKKEQGHEAGARRSDYNR